MEMYHQVFINWNKSNVYQAIKSEEGLKKWWTSDTEIDRDIYIFKFLNGKYWMKFKKTKEKENEEIEFLCVDTDEISKDWINTKLIFKLKENDGITIVSVIHSNWKQNSEIFPRCNSTWGFLMFSLKNYIENGKGNPIS